MYSSYHISCYSIVKEKVTEPATTAPPVTTPGTTAKPPLVSSENLVWTKISTSSVSISLDSTVKTVEAIFGTVSVYKLHAQNILADIFL